MDILLFGAGASYGSATTGAPPMGEALFDALRSFNPQGWGALPTAMASEFRADFEKGMARLATENPHAMPILQRAMAAFFYNFVPNSANLYVRLSERIRARSWSGAIATLNYERFIELSLLHAGIQPVVGQVAGSGQVELCLPHGCCHIFCDGARASSVGVSFSGLGVMFDGPVSVITRASEFRARLEGDAVPPVMSYFEPQKTTSAGASFIRSQRERWAQLASQATSLAVIGVRCRPHDSHIWEPVAASSADVVYCAGSTAGAEFRQWAATARPGKTSRVFPGYFAAEFENMCQGLRLA